VLSARQTDREREREREREKEKGEMNIHTVNDGPIEELLDEADPRTTSWNEFGVDERDVIGVLKAERGRYGSVAVTLIGRTVPRLLWTSTEGHVARVAVR